MPLPRILRFIARPSLAPVITGADAALGRLTGYRMSLLRILPGTCPVVLHLTGRRNGTPRHTNLQGARDGTRVYIVGSNWGGPEHPGWVHNLRSAGPRIEATVRGERGWWHWHELAGAERARAWRVVVHEWPSFENYAVTARPRTIPVFCLEPASAPN